MITPRSRGHAPRAAGCRPAKSCRYLGGPLAMRPFPVSRSVLPAELPFLAASPATAGGYSSAAMPTASDRWRCRPRLLGITLPSSARAA